MRKIVVGIGNDILGDDGVGLLVIDMLREEGIEADLESFVSHGIDVAQKIVEYDMAILVDASERVPAGEVLVTKNYELRGNIYSPHTLDICTSIELLRKLGKKIPEIYFVLVGVEKIEYRDEISSRAFEGAKKAKEIIRKLLEV